MTFELVHPNRPETHKNSAAPPIDPQLAEQLIKIGGLNYRNEPNLRFAWGQTRTQFRRGKDRLLYIDERIEPIRHWRNVLRRPLLLDDAGRVAQWETRVVDQPPNPMPEGWLYEKELVSLEYIGRQLWYVEQWYAPEIHLPNGETHLPFGTPEQWEKDRYEDWEDPEIGFVKRCDVLGPFPREGRYVAVFVIAQPFTYLEWEEVSVGTKHESESMFACPLHSQGIYSRPGKCRVFSCQLRLEPLDYMKKTGTERVSRLVEDVCYRQPDMIAIAQMRAVAHEREHRQIKSKEQREMEPFLVDAAKRTAAREARQAHAREFMKGEHWRWSSPDSGATGGIGGGARSYATPENQKPKKEEAA